MKAQLEALSRLSRIEPTIAHFNEFFAQVNDEKNERGAALMLAANVENALSYVVSRILTIKDGTGKLFGYDAPLSTFEAKIRIGYALDIFGPETKSNLDCIKAVRNAFAHAVIPISFKTKEVSDVCNLLVMPKTLPPDGSQKRYGRAGNRPTAWSGCPNAISEGKRDYRTQPFCLGLGHSSQPPTKCDKRGSRDADTTATIAITVLALGRS